MIVRRNPGFLRLFLVVRGSILPKILPKVLIITLLALLVAELHKYFPDLFPDYTTAPFTLLGISLSLFLGFRNNASYDRWWEGRRQWGQMLIDSRNLSRQLATLLDFEVPEGRQRLRRIAHLNAAFVHAARNRMRGIDPWHLLDSHLTVADRATLTGRGNLPAGILHLIGQELGGCFRRGEISDIALRDLNTSVNSLSLAYGSCERILNTPLPFAYMLLLHRTAYLYCLLLPWGLVAALGLATPVISAIIAYTFFGFDALSEELASPFGTEANDLPLNAMARNIEIELLEAVGEPLPPRLTPKDHVLL
ncbi:bestrophin family protein [Halotalea alkalilenta]|uniref:bestrophin family protein n=1 Tax=Halotalea alkalilenta TaxID=376489 RepID=UPI00048478F8|nr:bestrophin family ion channel [Halotalea alkalilenta]